MDEAATIRRLGRERDRLELALCGLVTILDYLESQGILKPGLQAELLAHFDVRGLGPSAEVRERARRLAGLSPDRQD